MTDTETEALHELIRVAGELDFVKAAIPVMTTRADVEYWRGVLASSRVRLAEMTEKVELERAG